MKILVATNKTQGYRESDFSWTVEGELVVLPPIECDCGEIDDGCGCHRALVGISSHRATTTVEVVELPELDSELYRSLIIDGLKEQGYLNDRLLKDAEAIAWVASETAELVALAEHFPVGSVLERRGNYLLVRPT